MLKASQYPMVRDDLHAIKDTLNDRGRKLAESLSGLGFEDLTDGEIADIEQIAIRHGLKAISKWSRSMSEVLFLQWAGRLLNGESPSRELIAGMRNPMEIA